MMGIIKVVYFYAKSCKTEKGGAGTTNGAAGSESKQNKGVREGFFGPGIQLFAIFHFWAQKRKIS